MTTKHRGEVLVFDLGKVLVDFDYSISAGRVAARSRITAAEAKPLLEQSGLLVQLETGTISPRQFYGEICAACGYSGTMDEFSATFADIFTEIPAMTALHAGLRAAGVPTYIFSNTNDIAISHIRARFPFFAHFDGYILSYEHGAMKPSARLYEVVEEMTGKKGREIVYLDDRAENAEAGAGRGWNAILHQTPAKTYAELSRLGWPVPTAP